ncbi:hypothetical protein D3C73_1455670 [compost metagenome]
MYSYADRLRAVELYIRLGKRLNATIRQLGYPTKKNALRGWYRDYLQHLDLRTQPVARAPKYSERLRGRRHLSTFAPMIVASLRR